jgi:hypothetical protein
MGTGWQQHLDILLPDALAKINRAASRAWLEGDDRARGGEGGASVDRGGA